ncbi:hypothetical protein [Chitinophaga sp. YIM B06452]|uniref:hypothetical protein n=1 Tax=Chitinophaga sp. YIM B06452 TaxID=3082158 RepID=UPI0031FF3D50
MKQEEKLAMKAISMCFRPYLKPEEAYIYTNLERTRFQTRCEEFGIYKNAAGYYKREDLDEMMSGAPSRLLEKAKQIKT